MKRQFYALLLLIPVLFSCEKPKDLQFKAVEDLEVLRFDGEEIVLQGKAAIHNPNPYSIEVTKANIDVKVNDVEVGKVEQNERTEVSGNSDFRLPLVVRFPPNKVFGNKGLLGGALNAIFKKKVDVYYKGTITVAALGLPIDIPVEATKEVKLKKTK